MTPQAAIAALDRQLAQHGQAVILRRDTGTDPQPLDVTVRAWPIGNEAVELQGRLKQGQRLVVLSPTEMARAQWCWPPRADDLVILPGDVPTSVLSVEEKRLGDTLVRLELVVRG